MPSINRLTAKQVVGLPLGLHADGGNLYLSVRPGGSRQWVMRYRLGGKQREIGLGGAGAGGMPLAEARMNAEAVRAQLRAGVDPHTARAQSGKGVVTPTFRTMMDEYITRNTPSWKNPKSAAQWRASLETHAKAILTKQVDQIAVGDVVKVLDPIWYELPETAKRVRGRIEAILSMSKTLRLRSGENPAAWRDNLKHVFRPKPKLVRGHFHSIAYEDAPAFVARLRQQTFMTALVNEWIILTVPRATVAVQATWAQINRAKRTWTTTAEQMKGTIETVRCGEDLVIPLCDRAIEILDIVAKLRITGLPDELVFPSQQLKPLSLTALDHCRERMGVETTTHGYRATFRTWAAQQTFHEGALAEKALGHLVGDETERAYNRGDLLEKRRMLMNDWADYLACAITPERNPFVRQGGLISKAVIDELRRRKDR